mgnify:CR=1 FL=1
MKKKMRFWKIFFSKGMKKTGRSKNFESKKSVKLRKMEKIAEEEQDEEHEQDFKDVEARAA